MANTFVTPMDVQINQICYSIRNPNGDSSVKDEHLVQLLLAIAQRFRDDANNMIPEESAGQDAMLKRAANGLLACETFYNP